MPPTSPLYENFDITVQSVPEGYLARVLNSPAGQAEALVPDGLEERELSNFLGYIDQMLDAVELNSARAPATELADECRIFGKYLFNALFTGDVLSMWRTSLASIAKGSGLRLRLRLTDTPELSTWPWEFLYDPVADAFMALTVDTPIMRYLDMPVAIEPLQISPPLRILVIAANPADLPELAVEHEWEKLQQGVKSLTGDGLVEVERLSAPMLPALQRTLRQDQYHVLHFIGHGEFDPETENGALAFEDDGGQSRMESATRIGTLLRDHKSLRLVVLNACEGGRVAVGSPFGGIAQTLARKGIPAVAAMQFEITDAAAIAFTTEFYAALADGYPVDAALTEARRAVYFAGNEVEWVTPVLFMRANDGRLFVQPRSSVSADNLPEAVQSNDQPTGQSTEARTDSQDKADNTSGIQVNIAGSSFSGSTFNIGNVGSSAQSGAASAGPASTATVSDNQAVQLTRLEGKIRRTFRALMGLEDRLSLSSDDDEQVALQRQMDEGEARLRKLIGDYTDQRPDHDWLTPADIQEALDYIGAR